MRLFELYTERRPNVAQLTAGRFDGFTIVETTGYWRGVREDSVIVRILLEDTDADAGQRAAVFELAEDIRAANEQQAVFVTESAVIGSLVTAKGAVELKLSTEPLQPFPGSNVGLEVV